MRRALILVAVLGALVAAGAASASSSPLAGVFKVKVKSSIAVLNGTWLVSFAPNGAYSIAKEPNTTAVLISGSSTVSGSTITLVDKLGPLACPGKTATGKYSWKLTGKTLKLTKLADACSGRSLVLAGLSLTKVR